MSKKQQPLKIGWRADSVVPALVALTEDLGSIPSTHLVAQKLLLTPAPGDPLPTSLDTRHTCSKHTCRQNIHIHKQL